MTGTSNNLTLEVMQAAIDKVRALPKPALREIVITRLVEDALKVTIAEGEEYILVHPATWARWLSEIQLVKTADAPTFPPPQIGTLYGFPVIESDERAREIMRMWIEKYLATRILPRSAVVADVKS